MNTDDLQKLIGEWGNATFFHEPKDVSRIILHLVEEVLELSNVPKEQIKQIQETVKPHILNSPDPAEAADCVMLLIHVAHVLGFSLETEVLKKFEECKKRTWGAPNEHGIIKHV